MLEFANAKSQRKINLKKDPMEFMTYFLAFCIFIPTAFFLYRNFKKFFLSPKLWLVASFIVYIVCIGGIVYNILRGTPFAGYYRNGTIKQYISRERRGQYIGEGLLMSSVFVIGGTAFYSFNWIAKIENMWLNKLFCAFAIFLIIAVLRICENVYKIKAKWYGPQFFPPGHYVHGPLMKDQGNSF